MKLAEEDNYMKLLHAIVMNRKHRKSTLFGYFAKYKTLNTKFMYIDKMQNMKL